MAGSAREEWGNSAAKLEKTLKANGIPINLDTNEGFNTVFTCMDGLDSCEYKYRDDMSDSAKAEALHVMHKMTEDLGVGVMVFKPDENTPRLLYWDALKDDYVVSEPIEKIQSPKKPSWWHRFLNRFTGAHQDEIDSYNKQKSLYDKASSVIGDRSYKKVIEERKTNPYRLYPSELKAASERLKFQRELEAKNEKNQEAIGKSIDNYDPIADVKEQMDALYKDSEEMELCNRMDFVMIDGSPVRSIMLNEFVEKNGKRGSLDSEDPADIEARNKRFLEIVTGAVAAGKHIDCYIPNTKDGALPEKPTPFIPALKAPAKAEIYAQKLPKLPELKTSELYAKRAEADKQIHRIASRNAMRVFARGMNGDVIPKAMFGDTDFRHIDNPLGFSITRTATISFTFAYLASQGYSMEELANPNMHLEAKRAAGKEVLDRMAAGDQAWLAEKELLGREKIVSEMCAKIDKTDLKNPDILLKPENHWLYAASDVLFDIDQEETHIKPGIKEVIADPNKPHITQELHDHIVGGSNGVLIAPKVAMDAIYESATAQLGMMDHAKDIPLTATIGNILFDVLKERKAANPESIEASITRKDFMIGGAMNTTVAMHPEIFETIKQANNLPVKEGIEFQKNYCKFVDLGGVAKHFKCTIDENTGMPMLSVENVPKKHTVENVVQKVSENAKLI